MYDHAQLHPRRTGFTLVELLVVISIIAILAGLLIAFMPSLGTQTAEANGAVNFQGWLNIARQRAIRTQNPNGVRLWIQNLNNPNPTANPPFGLVTECQFVEQPDDFTGGKILTSGPNSFTVNVFNNSVDPSGGFGNQTSLYPVQPGDYLEVFGTGLMHQITGVSSNGFQLATAIDFQVNSTPNYRVMRAARVIGEETLPLPSGVVIDLNTNGQFGNPLPPPTVVGSGGFVDVLFSPSGSVITPQLSQPNMNFWVRAPDVDPSNSSNPYYGTPTIISVFVNTGLVGAYPPAQLGNPYVDIR